MNLEKLKQKLKPQLHEFEIEGEKIFIHRPAGKDFQQCTDMANTLILCVKDENGDPIFANEDIDGRINVNIIDFTNQGKIFAAIMKLTEVADPVDEIEKK